MGAALEAETGGCDVEGSGVLKDRSSMILPMTIIETGTDAGGRHLGRVDDLFPSCEVSDAVANWKTVSNPAGIRTSERLAKGDKTPILIRAMARKARQCEGGKAIGVDRNIKLLIRKSRLCGVRLGEAEAMDFEGFLAERA